MDSIATDTIVVTDTVNQLVTDTIWVSTPASHREMFWGISEDLWLKIIMPFSIFFLGFILSFLVRKISRYKSNAQLKDYISTWITLTQDLLRKQSMYYRDFAEEVNSVDATPKGMYLNNLQIDKLKAIKHLDMKLLILDNLCGGGKDKADLLFRLTHEIDFVLDIYAGAIEHFGIYKEVAKLNYDEWNANMALFNSELNKLFTEYFSNIANDPFLRDLYPIQDAWKKHAEQELVSYISKEVVDKVVTLCHDYFDRTGFIDKRPMALLRAAEKLQTTILRLNANAVGTHARFHQNHINLWHARRGLIVCGEKLRRSRLKLICE